MAYFNANAACELSQLADTLNIIDSVLMDNNSTDTVCSALEDASAVIKQRIIEIFNDVEVSNDGIKHLKINDAHLTNWSNGAQTFEYHYTGLFKTNGISLILEPFTFIYEEPEKEEIDCNFELMFKTTYDLLIKNNNNVSKHYYTENERKKIRKGLPATISNLVYNYMLHVAGISKKPTALSIIPLRKELISFKEYLDGYDTSTVSALVSQINDIAKQDDELKKQHATIRDEMNEFSRKSNYWNDPDYKELSNKLGTIDNQRRTLNQQIESIQNTLLKEIKLCMDYEKKVVHLISYISDSHTGHKLFDTYKKYSNTNNRHMLPLVYDDDYISYTNGDDVTVCATNFLDDLMDDERRGHSVDDHRTLMDYTERFAEPTAQRNSKPAYTGCVRTNISEMRIPYIKTEDVDKLLDIFKTEYAANFEKFNKYHTVAERNRIDEKTKAMELAFYSTAKMVDALNATAIHTVDGTLNDLIFRPEMHNDVLVYHHNFCEDTLLFYPNTNHYWTQNVRYAQAIADRFDIIHQHVTDTVTKMISCLDDVQTRLASIDDTGFRAYLVKHKMLEA